MTENVHHLKYRPDIDGLRAIAVLSVVLYHGFPDSLPGGFAGVDVFFVISGFLISTILFQSIDRGTFSIADFYSRRIRRIFPALTLVLFSVLAFGWFCLLSDELQQLGKHTAASAGFIQNFTLWAESGYFDSASETKPLLHIWSLGIEEQFYFLWPLLLWGAGKIGGGESRKRIFYFLATVSVFTVSFTLNLNLIKVDPTKTFYLPQYRFFELALGGILSWVVLYKPGIATFRGSQGSFFSDWLTEERIKNVLALFGFVLLLVIFAQFGKETVFPGTMALLPVFATTFIIFAGPNSVLNKFFLSNRILVWFGLISFPLYLWHWPILSFGRIVYGEMPSLEFRLLAIAGSILLSWLTVKVIENPFRFGSRKTGLKVTTLCLAVFVIGGVGHFVRKSDGHLGRAKIKIRKNTDDIIGMSDRWYKGKDGWLFLGNAHDRTVSKLKLSITPLESETESMRELFSKIAKTASQSNTKVVLIVGPNKSNIYPEYLPDEITPSTTKYISFFLDKLKAVPNLTVYNPTKDLLGLKKTDGILYWKTDTHWNNKGAFLVFSGFAKRLGLPVPHVEFQHNGTHVGDLYGFAGIKDFPLHPEDNWDVVWMRKPSWSETEIPNEQESSFSKPSIVSNLSSLSDKKIWVVGDSFTNAQRQYLNATFREVRYVGHWEHKLKGLATELTKTDQKPDMIVVIRVERSF